MKILHSKLSIASGNMDTNVDSGASFKIIFSNYGSTSNDYVIGDKKIKGLAKNIFFKCMKCRIYFL